MSSLHTFVLFVDRAVPCDSPSIDHNPIVTTLCHALRNALPSHERYASDARIEVHVRRDHGIVLYCKDITVNEAQAAANGLARGLSMVLNEDFELIRQDVMQLDEPPTSTSTAIVWKLHRHQGYWTMQFRYTQTIQRTRRTTR
jgi:hypothetical protein